MGHQLDHASHILIPNLEDDAPHSRKRLQLFMEMKHSIEEDLESPEYRIHSSRICLKHPFVSFLPNKINSDGQGDSLHPKLHV